MSRSRTFSDVLYTQKSVYSNFSNGTMSIAETYVALAIGFLDPTSLPPMVIFDHDLLSWCRDTRRLVIARALEQNCYFPVLEKMQVIDAKKTDNNYKEQYNNLINERLPAMKRKKFDGKNVEVSTRKGRFCCFDLASNLFRDDVIEHVAKCHLDMTVTELENLNTYQCKTCGNETKLQFTRLGNRKQRKYYRIVRGCKCVDQGHIIDIPWQEVSFGRICDELRKYKSIRDPFSLQSQQIVDETDNFSSCGNETSYQTDPDCSETGNKRAYSSFSMKHVRDCFD
jgi:hypothetical protein